MTPSMRFPVLILACFCLVVPGGSVFGRNTRVPANVPERRDLELLSNQPATAQAFYEADIGAKVGGIVAEVMVDIGDAVKEGDALARIAVPELEQQRMAREAEARQLETGVAAAQAGLDAAQSEFDRVQGLVRKGSLTGKAGEEARERLATAKADFDAALATRDIAVGRTGEIDALIGYATLKAPFDGVVTHRGLDPGDLVGGNGESNGSTMPLLGVKKIDTLRVVAYLPEREAVHLDMGDPAEIRLDALPGKVFSGKVARYAKALDGQTRTMRVEVDLPNPDGAILPGLYGRMSIVLEKRSQALVLPPDSVRASPEGAYVFVVQNDQTVAKRAVRLGIDDGNTIEIVDGLDGTEKVVGGMIGRLTEGEAVTVIGH